MDKNSVVGRLLRNKMQFVLDCVEASLAPYNPKSGFKKTRLFFNYFWNINLLLEIGILSC